MSFVKYRKNVTLKKLRAFKTEKRGLDWTLVPQSMKHRVDAILERLPSYMTWTDAGEIILNDVYLPRTNITKLILYHVTKSGKMQMPLLYPKLKEYFIPWHMY